MNVLLIQSRTRPEMIAIEQAEYARAIGKNVQMIPISTLDESLPWKDPKELLVGIDVVIIGGSGEFDLDGGRTDDDPAKTTAHAIQKRLHPLIEYILEKDVPSLGICFGHQLIGNVRGGNVQNDLKQKKIGTHTVQLTDAGKCDPLTQILPEQFDAQYGHKDSITLLPHGATLIATAPNCLFAGLRYGMHVYTFQFHPELTRNDIVYRLKQTQGYLPEGADATSITRESPESSKLIPRFISLITA